MLSLLCNANARLEMIEVTSTPHKSVFYSLDKFACLLPWNVASHNTVLITDLILTTNRSSAKDIHVLE